MSKKPTKPTITNKPATPKGPQTPAVSKANVLPAATAARAASPANTSGPRDASPRIDRAQTLRDAKEAATTPAKTPAAVTSTAKPEFSAARWSGAPKNETPSAFAPKTDPSGPEWLQAVREGVARLQASRDEAARGEAARDKASTPKDTATYSSSHGNPQKPRGFVWPTEPAPREVVHSVRPSIQLQERSADFKRHLHARPPQRRRRQREISHLNEAVHRRPTLELNHTLRARRNVLSRFDEAARFRGATPEEEKNTESSRWTERSTEHSTATSIPASPVGTMAPLNPQERRWLSAPALLYGASRARREHMLANFLHAELDLNKRGWPAYQHRELMVQIWRYTRQAPTLLGQMHSHRKKRIGGGASANNAEGTEDYFFQRKLAFPTFLLPLPRYIKQLAGIVKKPERVRPGPGRRKPKTPGIYRTHFLLRMLMLAEESKADRRIAARQAGLDLTSASGVEDEEEDEPMEELSRSERERKAALFVGSEVQGGRRVYGSERHGFTNHRLPARELAPYRLDSPFSYRYRRLGWRSDNFAYTSSRHLVFGPGYRRRVVERVQKGVPLRLPDARRLARITGRDHQSAGHRLKAREWQLRMLQLVQTRRETAREPRSWIWLRRHMVKYERDARVNMARGLISYAKSSREFIMRRMRVESAAGKRRVAYRTVRRTLRTLFALRFCNWGAARSTVAPKRGFGVFR